jgi:hypothetical protein
LLSLSKYDQKEPKKFLHVPYRDSKLMYYLKDSLQGKCYPALIGVIREGSLENNLINTIEFLNLFKFAKNPSEDIIKYVEEEDHAVI